MKHTTARLPAALFASLVAVTLAMTLASGPSAAQAPDARRLNDAFNITGDVVKGARNAKHRMRIVYRQAPAQDLAIDAASETVFANMQAAYVAYRNKDSASKDFAVVVSPSGWTVVVYWADVVMLHKWTEP
jgi:hypothetical protein